MEIMPFELQDCICHLVPMNSARCVRVEMNKRCCCSREARLNLTPQVLFPALAKKYGKLTSSQGGLSVRSFPPYPPSQNTMPSSSLFLWSGFSLTLIELGVVRLQEDL